MSNIKSINFKKIKTNANKLFNNASDLNTLINEKSKFLGRNGIINILFKKIKNIELKKRKKIGIKINLLKKQIQNIFTIKKNIINEKNIKNKLLTEKIDVTLPGKGLSIGSLHPIMQTWERIEQIFCTIGFNIVEGPEIENDWYNFTALNNPKNHPARSMQDTFYINFNDKNNVSLLLRTHTSSMQIRYSELHKPPIKVIMPGRVYRVDNDSMHSPMFHQIEGLWIDSNISFSNLKGIYLNFLKIFFEDDNINIRFRPSYFPFTEPSAEIDIMFKYGKNAGKWLEISGAGQIHPNVMKNMNINTKHYTGFAFGSGIERLTMLRYGINNLRLFFKNDLRFLNQFSY